MAFEGPVADSLGSQWWIGDIGRFRGNTRTLTSALSIKGVTEEQP
jgi:hypothetical protein